MKQNYSEKTKQFMSMINAQLYHKWKPTPELKNDKEELRH